MSADREPGITLPYQSSTFVQNLRRASEQMERRVKEYQMNLSEQKSNHSAPISPVRLSGSGPASIDSANYPVTIDLTGPVIKVLKHNGNCNNNQTPMASSEKLYHKLVREAPGIPLTAFTRPKQSPRDVSNINSLKESIPPSGYIEDINPSLLIQGKTFIQRNFFALILAHLVSIALLLAVKPIQALLLRTGSVHKKENTLRRYLSLILCVKNLYECDLVVKKESDEGSKNGSSSIAHGNKEKSNLQSITTYQPNASSSTLKELKILQKVQEKVAKNFRIYAPPPIDSMKLDGPEEELLAKLKEDLELMTDPDVPNPLEAKNMEKIYTTVNPDVPLSQYDMAIVQFTFFGFVSLFPSVFGIHLDKENDEGLKGFIHIWGVFGKRLGLEDRFNLCLENNFDPETNMKLFKEVFLFSLKLADENLIRLWRSMTSRSSRYFYFFRTKSLIQFLLKNLIGISNAKNVLSCMNFWERFAYCMYDFGVKWVLRLWFPRVILNGIVKGIIYIGHRFYLRRMKKEKYMFQSSLISIRIDDDENESTKNDGLETIS